MSLYLILLSLDFVENWTSRESSKPFLSRTCTLAWQLKISDGEKSYDKKKLVIQFAESLSQAQPSRHAFN